MPGSHETMPGSHETMPGSHDLTPGTHDLTPGTHDLAPGTHDLAPGTIDLAPGTIDLAPGTSGWAWQYQCAGGDHVRRGAIPGWVHIPGYRTTQATTPDCYGSRTRRRHALNSCFEVPVGDPRGVKRTGDPWVRARFVKTAIIP